MSLERARKGFEGGILVKVAGIVSGVPQHASLCSPSLIFPPPPAWSQYSVLIRVRGLLSTFGVTGNFFFFC